MRTLCLQPDDSILWTDKIIRESAFDKKKKKPELNFNPGLALHPAFDRTTWPWTLPWAVTSTTETRRATGQERTPFINLCDDKGWGDGKFDVQTLTHLRLPATSFPGCFFLVLEAGGGKSALGTRLGYQIQNNKNNTLFSSWWNYIFNFT